MSVLSMAGLASNPPSPTSADSGPLQLLAAYIPSEALAVYLLSLGALVPLVGAPSGWVLFWKCVPLLLGLALAVLLAFRGYKDSAGKDRRKTLLLVLFAVVGFLFYSLATPGGPWPEDIAWVPTTQIGMVLAATATAVFAYAAPGLDLRNSSDGPQAAPTVEVQIPAAEAGAQKPASEGRD